MEACGVPASRKAWWLVFGRVERLVATLYVTEMYSGDEAWKEEICVDSLLEGQALRTAGVAMPFC